jgi:hypothetical protein
LIVLWAQVVILVGGGVVVNAYALPSFDVVYWVRVGKLGVILVFKGARRVEVGETRLKAWLASWLLIMRRKLIVELLI